MKTIINYEFANVSNDPTVMNFVTKGTVNSYENEQVSVTAAIRRVKKAIKWSNVKCVTRITDDSITLKPLNDKLGFCYITFHTSASV
jgi:hypothetical protein